MTERMGLFAIGTSCLALVCVIGRSRVPAPPARISPFIRPEISTGGWIPGRVGASRGVAAVSSAL
jgi:hypothetical protein